MKTCGCERETVQPETEDPFFGRLSEKVNEVQDSGLAEAIRTGVVLVDFWAPRCRPCLMQGPILEDVAAAIGGKAVIVKVNIDENLRATGAFEFKSIPALILLKYGDVQLIYRS